MKEYRYMDECVATQAFKNQWDTFHLEEFREFCKIYFVFLEKRLILRCSKITYFVLLEKTLILLCLFPISAVLEKKMFE